MTDVHQLWTWLFHLNTTTHTSDKGRNDTFIVKKLMIHKMSERINSLFLQEQLLFVAASQRSQ